MLQIQNLYLLVVDYLQSLHDHLLHNQRHAFVILLSVFLFWPAYLYCLVLLTSASSFSFWLLASIFICILQFFYIIYQFLMIAVDIFVLTLLKTYQVIVSFKEFDVRMKRKEKHLLLPTNQFFFNFKDEIKDGTARLLL